MTSPTGIPTGLGVDYASVDENHTPNFTNAASFGVRFAGVRAAFTFKGQTFADPCVARDRDALAAAGIQFFPYLILGWTVDPLPQVDKFEECVGDLRPGELPVALDVEFPGNGISDYRLTPAEALARIETALAALQSRYGVVMIYTSRRVWTEDLGDIDSSACAVCPLWLKTPYVYRERNPPHPENPGPIGELPGPWKRLGVNGGWIHQYQGDAINVPGFSSTVDLNRFLPYAANPGDERTGFVVKQLGAHGVAVTNPFDAVLIRAAIRQLQANAGLDHDGVIGPRTFAALCAKS